MSSISSVGGSSQAWAVTPREAPPPRGDKLFDKLDADASDGIDATELQDFVDHVKQRSGQDLGSADDVLKQLDADSSGALDDSELREGLRELMPAPSSTLQFAERRMEGPPPPPPASADDAANDSTVGGLASAMSQLLSAIDSDGDDELSDSEMQRFGEVLQQSLEGDDAKAATSDGTASTSSDPAAQLTQLIQRMLAQYTATAADTAIDASSNGASGSLNVSA